MTQKDMNQRSKLIGAIKTPLGFFSLVVLVTEATLAGLAMATSGSDRTFLLYAIVGILTLLILLVSVIAIFRPEALQGENQPSTKKHSHPRVKRHSSTSD